MKKSELTIMIREMINEAGMSSKQISISKEIINLLIDLYKIPNQKEINNLFDNLNNKVSNYFKYQYKWKPI